jgi:hypothetical protein
MSKKLDPSTVNPEFFLDEDEVVIQTLKFRKYRKPSLLVQIILTVLTLGLFLLFKHLFKKIKSVEVVKLTNKRILEWELELPDRGLCGTGKGTCNLHVWLDSNDRCSIS